ncbi:uncharacterized protein LOC130707181 [Balaenoptera acutorostrata]|uniref:Uncharacterized protein LOC130707181 n=1 Tax=Balaenoptera acutorostrata TaxID=9767 RepID=A0ABM3T2Q9_BALAC|nr:uncharacterized protein LOC130707181 [Balaenoptera acutorostrata]
MAPATAQARARVRPARQDTDPGGAGAQEPGKGQGRRKTVGRRSWPLSVHRDPAAALSAAAKSSGAPPLPEESRRAGLMQNTEEALLSYFRFFLYLKGRSGCGTSYATPCVGKWERKLIFKVQRRLSSPLLGVGWWVEKAAVGTRPSAVLGQTEEPTALKPFKPQPILSTCLELDARDTEVDDMLLGTFRPAVYSVHSLPTKRQKFLSQLGIHNLPCQVSSGILSYILEQVLESFASQVSYKLR